ncbi:hypothetical protein N9W22_06260 [Schleiferiaceae bacterium]|nr:hypothetical protein [Schleiferiaceae bacterium]MDB2404896.1 hypothetical protein [Schleiferiaceae bacterium]
MKQTIFIISILFSIQCLGQKWHLHNVDENEEYPFEYWFQFENLEDTCSYKLTENPVSLNSVFKLTDNNGDPVILTDIKVINLESESETYLISDFDGVTELQLDNGKYRIEVTTLIYDKFNTDFEIKNNQQVELKIKLGRAPELVVYQLNSKKELIETEILEIIECERANLNDSNKRCSDLKKYRIMMHI